MLELFRNLQYIHYVAQTLFYITAKKVHETLQR